MKNIVFSHLVTVCLSQMNNQKTKYTYYNQSIEIINKIKETNIRPKLLLHACCAPCATYPLEFLSDTFECTIYFNNSNIYPESEYIRRLNELEKYLEISNSKTKYPVQLIIPPYQGIEYTKKLEPLKDYPEGQQRCFLCYSLRMRETYQYAADNHYDYFTTVMTISRQKSSQKLNEIGQALSIEFPTVQYLYSDFKKHKGIDRSRQLTAEYGLYKQQYCGCIYSYQEYMKKKLY